MAYRNDLVWMRYQGLKGLDRQGYIDQLMGHDFRSQTGGQLAVIDRASGWLIGDLYLRITPPDCLIGFTVSPIYARQGYGFEAVSGLIEALSQLPDITVMKADVDPGNLASIGLLRKLGFAQTRADDDSLYFELTVAVALS